MSHATINATPDRTVRLGGMILLVLLAAAIAVPSARASLDGVEPGEGLLTVSSDPPVATQIRVGNIERNTGHLKALPLPVGEHLVCFSGPQEYLTPGCRPVVIQDGKQTSLVVEFLRSVDLEVVVEPAELRPRVTIDGVDRDVAPLRIPLAEGTSEVCLQELAGYEPVDCRTVELVAGQPHRVMVEYQPATPPVEEPVDVEPIDEEPVDEEPVDGEPVDEEPTAGDTEVTVVSTGSTSQRGPSWTASLRVMAADGSGVVPGTTIEAVWSAGTPTLMECVTDEDGTCTLTQSTLHNRDNPVTVTVFRVDDAVIAGPIVTISR